MKSENKEDLLIKLLKAKKININEITNLLKTNKIDLDKIDSHGFNCLHYAIKADSADVVSLMLNPTEEFMTEKADPNIPTGEANNLSPILYALITCNESSVSYRIIKLLHRAGGNINTKDDQGCTLLHRCCEKGRLDILNYLFSLEQTPDINQLCQHGSGLHMAIIGDQDEIVTFFLDKHIDLSLKDSHENTALHLAIQLKVFNQFKQICDYVIASDLMDSETKKKLFNSINDEGNTILHELAYAKSSVLVDYINRFKNEYKVDQEAKNKQGYTYKGVQDNIIKLNKDREENEKLKREQIRKEKEKIADEMRREIAMQKEEEIKERELEEKKKELGLKLIKYRTHIFLAVFVVLMVLLYIFIDRAARQKKKEVILY